jgi:hypothetical protein
LDVCVFLIVLDEERDFCCCEGFGLLLTAKCVCSVTDLLVDVSETPKPVYDSNMSIIVNEICRTNGGIEQNLPTVRKVSAFPDRKRSEQRRKNRLLPPKILP